MNIQQFREVSHVDYGCLSMPQSNVELLARPGEKFKDPSDYHIIFPRKLKATDYTYSIGTWDCGTADEVVSFYEHQLSYEFSKEQDRHIFHWRPYAEVHFLDGSKQTIYFNNTDEVAKFSNQMKTQLGLDKHLLVDRGAFVGVGEIRPFEDPEVVKK